MRRLYNDEYNACRYTEAPYQRINELMSDAIKKIWEEVVVAYDVCPRDAASVCHEILAIGFSENILRRALDARRTRIRRMRD